MPFSRDYEEGLFGLDGPFWSWIFFFWLFCICTFHLCGMELDWKDVLIHSSKRLTLESKNRDSACVCLCVCVCVCVCACVCVRVHEGFRYRVFHRFGQAKFPDSGSVLGLSQFSILPRLPVKMILGLKVVKIDSKISNLLC